MYGCADGSTALYAPPAALLARASKSAADHVQFKGRGNGEGESCKVGYDCGSGESCKVGYD